MIFVQVTASSIKVMVGNSYSYPSYPSIPLDSHGEFPHSLSMNILEESLENRFVFLSDVAEIKKNPVDDFSILTLTKYVDRFANFAGNTGVTYSPLCLPENPNQFYDNLENNVKVHGYAYDVSFEEKIKEIARREKDANKMQGPSRHLQVIESSQVFSRRKCLQQFGKAGDRLEGKGGPGPEDMELKV